MLVKIMAPESWMGQIERYGPWASCIEKKNLLLQNHQANFNQTWYKASLGEGNSKLFK
jgi:hypothetical protein